MIAGILKETGTENRVAMLPGEVAGLKKLGLDVIIEKNAGEKAFIDDEAYAGAGAEIADRDEVKAKAAILLAVNPPLNDDPGSFKEGQIICSALNPVENREWIDKVRQENYYFI